MEWGILLLVLLVLACPISMMWMMRRRHGMHGGHGMPDAAAGRTQDGMRENGARRPTTAAESPERRLAELQARREALEREIDTLQSERRSPKADRQQ